MKRGMLEDISDINRLKVMCIMVFGVHIEGVVLKESPQTVKPLDVLQLSTG